MKFLTLTLSFISLVLSILSGCNGYLTKQRTLEKPENTYHLIKYTSVTRSDTNQKLAICILVERIRTKEKIPYTLFASLKDEDRYHVEISSKNKIKETTILFNPLIGDIEPGCTKYEKEVKEYYVNETESEVPEYKRNSIKYLENKLSATEWIAPIYDDYDLSKPPFLEYTSTSPIFHNGQSVKISLRRLDKALAREGALLDTDNIPYDVNREIVGGATLLHFAASQGDFKRGKRLIEHGGKVNAKTDKGATPLMLACKSGNISLVKMLIEKGADVNHTSRKGGTPLMTASRFSFPEIVEFLLKNGADPKVVDQLGYNAWGWAKVDANYIAMKARGIVYNSYMEKNIKTRALLEKYGCCD